MKNLIGISGKMGSGKDEVGQIIQSLATPEGTYTRQEAEALPFYTIRKFAFKVKEVASILTNIDVQKFEEHSFKKEPLGESWEFDGHTLTGRELLQKIGTEMGRSIHPNAWVNALFSEYVKDLRRIYNSEGGTTIAEGYPNWIITDVRFVNEAKAIKDRGGIVIRVNRPSVVIDQHPSEISLDDYEGFDYVIENDGSLKDLDLKVAKIYEEL